MFLTHVLLASCPDAPGISAAVTGFIAQSNGFILDSQQHGDNATGQFFLRIAFKSATDETLDVDSLTSRFAAVAKQFAMRFGIFDAKTRPQMLIAVSRFGHCLNDLLHRWRTGSLPVEIVGVVSNHDDMRALVEWHGLPYHHLPIKADTKAAQEQAFRHIIEASGAELVVLARYMQILSAEFSTFLAGRCINIHHSFLPSFKGAKPYHQAYERGVKLIGATAHYVTDDLDEGPIIEQDVERVDHGWSASQLVEAGQDIEARVLARAVRWHVERRVLRKGNKTVVFR
ncbi:formyltetrahydrofolate deformylase [Novosphingobium sp. P6W]|nr:formyltetrahydrofolate deformylase [Novosphingobium sp. P6W]KIS29919.1 formyltetrahydrofolate deformylase [Novosphingobium sp. P6W]